MRFHVTAPFARPRGTASVPSLVGAAQGAAASIADTARAGFQNSVIAAQNSVSTNVVNSAKKTAESAAQ